jgi:hypothetical protein
MLARCYWKLERLGEASREFQGAIGRQEAAQQYLRMCLDAITTGAPSPTTAPAARATATATAPAKR